jgi:hypothetical protein
MFDTHHHARQVAAPAPVRVTPRCLILGNALRAVPPHLRMRRHVLNGGSYTSCRLTCGMRTGPTLFEQGRTIEGCRVWEDAVLPQQVPRRAGRELRYAFQMAYLEETGCPDRRQVRIRALVTSSSSRRRWNRYFTASASAANQIRPKSFLRPQRCEPAPRHFRKARPASAKDTLRHPRTR